MNAGGWLLRAVLAAVGVVVPATMVGSWLGGAEERLTQSAERPPEQVAIASVSEDAYCTPELKGIVRRVAGACGLLDGAAGRGCQPAEAKKLVQLSGEDFNKMFMPLARRAWIIQYDVDNTALDDGAQAAVEKAWSNQGGASFFFVVARASPEGKAAYNQELSRSRAESVLTHLQTRFDDPDIKKEVGLLWLGEEFAQLDNEFCSWQRSRQGECTDNDINRSAFVAWIDCAI